METFAIPSPFLQLQGVPYIMQEIPEIAVGSQMERIVSDRNIDDPSGSGPI